VPTKNITSTINNQRRQNKNKTKGILQLEKFAVQTDGTSAEIEDLQEASRRPGRAKFLQGTAQTASLIEDAQAGLDQGHLPACLPACTDGWMKDVLLRRESIH